MDAHTARCLQLSTSIMPFNPYRQYRVPDHFNRPRFPSQMPQQQARMQPARAISFDAWTTNSSMKPVYKSGYPSVANAQDMHGQTVTPPLVSTCTPDSTYMGSSYFPNCQSPETADLTDVWNSTLSFDNLNENQIACEDFGLGLGALGADFAPIAVKSQDAENFPYPGLLNEVETLAFDPGSPDGQSWSSLSESSSGLVSDHADTTTDTDVTGMNPELAADLDAFLRSETSTPNLPPHGIARASHCRAESSPRHNFRTSPYPTTAARSRSFSTGSVALPRTQRSASTFVHSVQQTPELGSEHTSPSTATNSIANFSDNEFELFYHSQQGYGSNLNEHSQLAFSSVMDDPFGETAKSSLMTSPDLVNILHSNGPDRHPCEHHFAGSTSPPDLFGPLCEEQSSPPPEDFECDESMMPRAQDLRFEGDMYTPRYVRGHGNKREGWCGICKPGRWLVLKNSAFWYDKSFSHGISAATGSAFDGPRDTRRMKGNPDVWEGLCGSCGEWIALISSKKKGTTWFRHAYKCHTHQKVKDTLKRRREVTHTRAPKAPKAASIKSESREETPFSVDSSLPPLDEEREAKSKEQGNTVLHTIAGML